MYVGGWVGGLVFGPVDLSFFFLPTQCPAQLIRTVSSSSIHLPTHPFTYLNREEEGGSDPNEQGECL